MRHMKMIRLDAKSPKNLHLIMKPILLDKTFHLYHKVESFNHRKCMCEYFCDYIVGNSYFVKSLYHTDSYYIDKIVNFLQLHVMMIYLKKLF